MSDHVGIIEKVRESYGTCTHYFDAGLAVTKSGAAHQRVTQLHFATSFIRGASFAMTVHQRDIPVKGHNSTWAVAGTMIGADMQHWWSARGMVEPVDTLHRLFARSSGVCQGLTGWTIPLLLPEAYQYGILARLRTATVAEDNVGGIDCLCLSGTMENGAGHAPSVDEQASSQSPIIVWVEKESFFIKRTLLRMGDSEFVVDQQADFDHCVKKD